jgi:hypothetical protein
VSQNQSFEIPRHPVPTSDRAARLRVPQSAGATRPMLKSPTGLSSEDSCGEPTMFFI